MSCCFIIIVEFDFIIFIASVFILIFLVQRNVLAVFIKKQVKCVEYDSVSQHSAFSTVFLGQLLKMSVLELQGRSGELSKDVFF